MGNKLTYKLEPGLARISSPIVLAMPDGTERKYESGEAVCKAEFEQKYLVMEMRAQDCEIEIRLEMQKNPEINTIDEVTFF